MTWLAPVIETERLRLRGHRRDDFPDCATMWGDPAVVRFIGGVPSTPQQTWSRILAYAGHWRFMGFGYWVIEQRETRVFAGEIGFADFKRDIASPMQGVPEFGFALVAREHGHGYASEAARGALRWADDILHAARTVALVRPENAPSLRVLEKCGYRIFEHGSYQAQASLFCERMRGSA